MCTHREIKLLASERPVELRDHTGELAAVYLAQYTEYILRIVPDK